MKFCRCSRFRTGLRRRNITIPGYLSNYFPLVFGGSFPAAPWLGGEGVVINQ
jgi:hypothetical protein